MEDNTTTVNIKDAIDLEYDKLLQVICENIEKTLKEGTNISAFGIMAPSGTDYDGWQEKLSLQNYPVMVHKLDNEKSWKRVYFSSRSLSNCLKVKNFDTFLYKYLRKYQKKAVELEEKKLNGRIKNYYGGLKRLPVFKKLKVRIIEEITENYRSEKVFFLLEQNPFFSDLIRHITALETGRIRAREEMPFIIPENPVNLFPEARLMKRHFYLHIGPTNSGKTYSAMQALKKAGSGVYLAPLRLLAFEQYESLSEQGYPCSMITGEERIEQEGTLFTSSTIEMVDMDENYECAVIDECQMISDLSRGGTWTKAVLGLQCPEIHLCAAPEAEKLLIRLIEECHDTFDIVRHERQTPLREDRHKFTFPNDIRPGDALIVFSRKNVHAVASEINRSKGVPYQPSIIYGALPYDVRHEEARRFSSGETQVVVATDAIGMGMNLPIKRVVFLEGVKFDGKTRRELQPDEIKQIAGRAGRYGIYDTGYYTSEMDERPIIRNGMRTLNEELTLAVLAFPEELLSIEAPLSVIIEQWENTKMSQGYYREDTKEMLLLSKAAEDEGAGKFLSYKLAMIPFDTESDELYGIWHDIVSAEVKNEAYDTDRYVSRMKMAYDELGMEALEQEYKVCDMLYYYNETFGYGIRNQEVTELKQQLSERIILLLKDQKLKPKTCINCGRILKWNYPYGLCQKCFHSRRR